MPVAGYLLLELRALTQTVSELEVGVSAESMVAAAVVVVGLLEPEQETAHQPFAGNRPKPGIG